MAILPILEKTVKPAPIVGVEALRSALKTVPTAPGIYKMTDQHGKILYIGKAKNLFNRVTSYTNISNLNNRIMRMVNQIHSVEIVVTKNEAEALLMEAGLVRRLQPRYNVLLKDDKSFPYLRLDTSSTYPRIEKHRGAQSKPGEYFGPFANVGALNATMAILQKIFLLRPCDDSIFKNRSRPCLQYQIKRCTAPCVNYVTVDEYDVQVKRARDFLKGRGREVQEMLSAEMELASEAMDYEKAALLRDRIKALTAVQQDAGLRVAGLKDADVIALARRGDKSVVQVFFFREGAHFGNQSFYPRHAEDETDADVLAGFMGQFYQAHLPPPEILLNASLDEGDVGSLLFEDRLSSSVPYASLTPAATRLARSATHNDESGSTMRLLEEAFAIRAGYGVEIRVPQRGDKLTLVTNAQLNAQRALERLEMERASVATHLLQLKELFGLKAMPSRIEVYDNSHISGTNAVGAFIVATPEGFDRKGYRTFNIKDLATEPGDDYAMMREVFRRRFKRAMKEDGEAWAVPDLILIDGGLGQLSSVQEALAEIGMMGLNLVAISKGPDRNAGREYFHQPGKEPFQLPLNDPTLHYLQRLRDEVHRFAIGKHRNKRSKSFTASALDDIPGIGGTRKKALLQHFGSRKAVETASIAELEKVNGINKTTARSIYDYFHGA